MWLLLWTFCNDLAHTAQETNLWKNPSTARQSKSIILLAWKLPKNTKTQEMLSRHFLLLGHWNSLMYKCFALAVNISSVQAVCTAHVHFLSHLKMQDTFVVATSYISKCQHSTTLFKIIKSRWSDRKETVHHSVQWLGSYFKNGKKKVIQPYLSF